MTEHSDRPRQADDIRPDLPTWVDIVAQMRQELRALAERVGRLEREVRTR